MKLMIKQLFVIILYLIGLYIVNVLIFLLIDNKNIYYIIITLFIVVYTILFKVIFSKLINSKEEYSYRELDYNDKSFDSIVMYIKDNYDVYNKIDSNHIIYNNKDRYIIFVKECNNIINSYKDIDKDIEIICKDYNKNMIIDVLIKYKGNEINNIKNMYYKVNKRFSFVPIILPVVYYSNLNKIVVSGFEIDNFIYYDMYIKTQKKIINTLESYSSKAKDS